MLYIDTSVLLVYTLTQAVEQDRYRPTERLFAQITDRSLSAATRFVPCMSYMCSPWITRRISPSEPLLAKAHWRGLSHSRCKYFPLYLAQNGHDTPGGSIVCETPAMYRMLSLHFVYGCEAIVAYDDHFLAVSDIIPYKKPEDYQ